MSDYFRILIIVIFLTVGGLVGYASWAGIGLNSFKDPAVMEAASGGDCRSGRRDAYGNCIHHNHRYRHHYGRSYWGGSGK